MYIFCSTDEPDVYIFHVWEDNTVASNAAHKFANNFELIKTDAHWSSSPTTMWVSYMLRLPEEDLLIAKLQSKITIRNGS